VEKHKGKKKKKQESKVLGLGFQNISKGHLLNGGIGGCWVTQAIALQPLGIKKAKPQISQATLRIELCILCCN
jgi:hypothetical protein